MDRHKVHQFVGWGYAHHSGSSRSLGWGIAQGGHDSDRQYADLWGLLSETWGWPDTHQYLSMTKDAQMFRQHSAKGISLVWIHGMLTLASPHVYPAPWSIKSKFPWNRGWQC